MHITGNRSAGVVPRADFRFLPPVIKIMLITPPPPQRYNILATMTMHRQSPTGIPYTDSKISAPPIHFVKIHPLVIFKMSDSYERSPSSERDFISPTLGQHHDGVAIVHDRYSCLPNPSTVVHTDLNGCSYDRHRQLFPNEQVLGYYAFSQQRVEWSSIFEANLHGIHIWMRPSLPPKCDVFEITKTNPQGPLFVSPIEYVLKGCAASGAKGQALKFPAFVNRFKKFPSKVISEGESNDFRWSVA
jgi:hypothetical protein